MVNTSANKTHMYTSLTACTHRIAQYMYMCMHIPQHAHHVINIHIYYNMKTNVKPTLERHWHGVGKVALNDGMLSSPHVEP